MSAEEFFDRLATLWDLRNPDHAQGRGKPK